MAVSGEYRDLFAYARRAVLLQYNVASSTEQQPALEIDPLRERIDAALGRYAHFDGDCPAQLAEAIRYALLGPGKRLRPRLVLMAAEACGGSLEAAMPAACAVEIVHAYSLVHDDLPAMDDDDLRRGRPTCHKQFGEAVAAVKCCAVLGRAAGASALVGGQADDLAMAVRDGLELNGELTELEAIHRRKTGALIVAALALGGIIGDGTPVQIEALKAYGRHLGLAFQITDDLLDVAGNAAAVGKRLAKDADRGKLTFPRLMGVEASRRTAEKHVMEACAMIEVFGEKGVPLGELARVVLERKN
jgi:geranylgeranyl diphosphate synthase type II